MPVAEAIRALWSNVRVPGGQGYLLSRPGAETLLRRTEEDGFFGDVDWRLVAYCMERESLESLPLSTFAHQALTAQFGVIASRPPPCGDTPFRPESPSREPGAVSGSQQTDGSCTPI